jgi:hypothetical protein
MHIHFGRRRVDQRKGKVADFCPICRDIGAFEFFRVASVFHVFGVAIGQGSLIKNFARCEYCSFKLFVKTERYTAIVEDKNRGLDWLISETFPTIRDFYADRLKLEAVIRKDLSSLNSETRRALILEPFTLINPLVEEHFAGQTPLDWPSSLGCLGTIVLTSLAFAFAIAYRRTPIGDKWLLVTLFVGLICTAIALYQFYLRPFRYLRRRLVPMLGRALRPLNPSREELDQSLAQSRQAALLIGKHVEIDCLWEAIQQSSHTA